MKAAWQRFRYGYRIYHLERALRLWKWPWVSRKKYDADIQHKNTQFAEYFAKQAVANERSFAALQEQVYRLHLDVVRGPNGQQFILTVRFNQELMMRGERWEEWAPYVAKMISAQVERALVKLDFSRMKPWAPEHQPRQGFAAGMDLDSPWRKRCE
jgi:hypothetical protein